MRGLARLAGVLANQHARPGIPIVPPPPPSPGGGVGSVSTSHVDYPVIPDSTTGDWYVDGSVGSSGNGLSLGTAFKTIQEGLAVLSSGQTLIVKGGTYNITGSGIYRNTAWGARTYIKAYGDEQVVLDGSGISYDRSILTFSGSVNEVWHRVWAKNSQAGGNNDGQAVRFVDGAHDCLLSKFWVSHCRQTAFYGYTGYNIIIQDSAAWRLGDGVSTGTNVADAFALTGNVNGGYQGIRYVRCVSAHAPDDAFDHFRNQGAIDVDCVAISPGYYWNGNPAGDGNGFKMGSAEATAHSNQVIGSLVVGARNIGFDDNATDFNTVMRRNTAILCGGFGFQAGSGTSATIRDNIGFDNGTDYIEYAAIPDSFNTWNLGITDPLFEDPLNDDYSLSASSPCIGASSVGGNLGASDVAYALYKEWSAKDLT